MSAFSIIIKYLIRDIARSRMLAFYTTFFLLLSEAFLRFGGSASALLSLSNVSLLIVPLVTLSFAVMHTYSQQPFHLLLLSQPLERRTLMLGMFVGLTIPLSASYAIGIALPFALRALTGVDGTALMLTLLSGISLTAVFVAIALTIAVSIDDHAKGFALAILTWLLLTVFYDGLILVLIRAFSEYPIERAVVVSVIANPIDLFRTIQMLHFDIAALMGYTGTVLHDSLLSPMGLVGAGTSTIAWITLPYVAARRRFIRKDF